MISVSVHNKYLERLVYRGFNPTHFINKLLDQHFEPYKYAEYENELIKRQLKDTEVTEEEMVIIQKYLTHQILKEFKTRMYQRYDRRLIYYSLDHQLKRLSLAIIDCRFDKEMLEKYHGGLINIIKSQDPSFNLNTYMDNLMRVKYMSTRQQKVIGKLDSLNKSDPIVKRFNKL